MKQFGAIFKFEFLNIVKTKSYIIITVLLVAIMGIVISFNQITNSFSDGDSDDIPPDTEKETLLIKNDTDIPDELYLQGFKEIFSTENLVVTENSVDEISDSVKNDRSVGAVYIKTEKSFNYIVKDITMYDETVNLIEETIKNIYVGNSLSKAGISDKDISALLGVEIKSDVIAVGVNQVDYYFYTYALLILLFMSIIMYGSQVAMSVVSEKSSRTMEILITSAKPKNLIFGKVLGAGFAGLLQFAIILLSGFCFFRINAASWESDSVIALIFNIPPKTLSFALIFFIGGYFIYAFLYAAFASLVSRTEEINTVVMPIQMILMLVYMLVMVRVISGNLDDVLMKVLSIIPFSSPMAMFVRISMGAPSAIEISVSIAVLFASIIFIGYLSAAMYRLGVLMYGKPPKMNEVFKIMKQSISKKD